jgi:hypothetical protein
MFGVNISEQNNMNNEQLYLKRDTVCFFQVLQASWLIVGDETQVTCDA